ncbi:MAG: hypothetical protein HY722_15800 [Planctomycetes bacterium]|nr:hypothetical protein [Planctomycetota bacterium]
MHRRLRFPALPALAAALAASASAARPVAAGPGAAEVITVRPADPVDLVPRVSLVYSEVDVRRSPAALRLRGSDAVARALADWRRARELGRSRTGLALCLATGVEGVSYTHAAPYLLRRRDGGLEARVGTVVTLSRGTVERLASGEGGEETVCHELGHAILMATHGPAYPRVAAEGLTMALVPEGHWPGRPTDPEFAFSEGWAEFCGWYYTLGAPAKDYLAEGGPERWRRDEGAVATLLLAVASSEALGGGSARLLEVLAAERPRTLEDLLAAWARLHPEDEPALREAVRSIRGGLVPWGGARGPARRLQDRGAAWARAWATLRAAARDPGRWGQILRHGLGVGDGPSHRPGH